MLCTHEVNLLRCRDCGVFLVSTDGDENDGCRYVKGIFAVEVGMWNRQETDRHKWMARILEEGMRVE
jgi:hypothetical protein